MLFDWFNKKLSVMAIYYSIFLCLAVIITSQQTIFAAPVLQQLEAFIEVNSTVLDQFIQNNIDNAFGDYPFLFNLNTTVLEDYVKKIIKKVLCFQPSKFSSTGINLLFPISL